VVEKTYQVDDRDYGGRQAERVEVDGEDGDCGRRIRRDRSCSIVVVGVSGGRRGVGGGGVGDESQTRIDSGYGVYENSFGRPMSEEHGSKEVQR